MIAADSDSLDSGEVPSEVEMSADRGTDDGHDVEWPHQSYAVV